MAGCGRPGGRFLVAVVRRSGAAQARDCSPVGGKYQKAAVSPGRSGIARVSDPLDSPLSKTSESGVRISMADRGSPGGRFLAALASWRRGSRASGLDRGCADRTRPGSTGKPAVWSLRNDLRGLDSWSWKGAGANFSRTHQLAVGGQLLQTAESPNFREFDQTGPLFVSKNAWRGPPP